MIVMMIFVVVMDMEIVGQGQQLSVRLFHGQL